jgi:hypothetical protein
MPSSPNAYLIIARVSVAIFRRSAQRFDAHSLSDPSRNRIRPDTDFQIKGRKESARPRSCVNSVHWLPRCARTISSTVASRCYNCRSDDNTSTRSYAYRLVYQFEVWNRFAALSIISPAMNTIDNKLHVHLMLAVTQHHVMYSDKHARLYPCRAFLAVIIPLVLWPCTSTATEKQ